ncbi:hypothetical protein A2U01_0107841, partial [Trifolium medium]|nr:hypothetical protein [Trifolium medium]
VWNGLKDTPKSVAMRAAHMMNEWRVVNTRQQQRRSDDIRPVELQWQ